MQPLLDLSNLRDHTDEVTPASRTRGPPGVATPGAFSPLGSHAAQVDFGKLWDATKRALAEGWTSESGTSSTLFLYPRGPSLIDDIMLIAKAQKGTLPRISVKVPASEAEASLPEVRRRLEAVAPSLPVPARLKGSRVSGQFVAVDLEVSLSMVLGEDADQQAQGERLLAEVAPVAQAFGRRRLAACSFPGPRRERQPPAP